MKIIDRLYEECNTPVELWGGDTVAPLQCDRAYGTYRILQWDVVKRDYVEWISCFSPSDMLLRYFRAKCFEGELLDCDNFEGQLQTLYQYISKGELVR